MLQVRPLCVCEIQAVLNLATSTVSKHLAILRDAGFVVDEKKQKWVNYRLNRQSANNMIHDLLPLLLCRMPDDEILKKDRVLVKTVDRNKLCMLS